MTIVELMDQLIPGADKDIVTPLLKRIARRYEKIFLKTKVTQVEAGTDGLEVGSRAAARPRRTLSTSLGRGRAPAERARIEAENAGVARR